MLHSIGLGSDFSYVIPKAQATKEKNKQLELHETCALKDTVDRIN